jgi:hypothetical protein
MSKRGYLIRWIEKNLKLERSCGNSNLRVEVKVGESIIVAAVRFCQKLLDMFRDINEFQVVIKIVETLETPSSIEISELLN